MSSFKRNLLFVFYLVAGVVLGALIANLCDGVRYLDWLSYYLSFGLNKGTPLVLDMGVLQLTFGLSIGIYAAQIFTIGLAMFLYGRSRIR